MSTATELDIVSSAVRFPRAEITLTALIIDPKASDEDLSKIGAALVSIEGSRSWWIGDYACALQARKGEHYTDGRAEALGIEQSTFWQYKAVASFFNPSTRVEDLTFKHHFEAMCGADGDLAVAQDWLDQAVKNEWSVSDLRRAVRTAKAEYKSDGLNPTGNGYSALLEANRWASTQLKEIGGYTAEQAVLILADTPTLWTLGDELRRIAGVSGADANAK
jgi:hypothetical protein